MASRTDWTGQDVAGGWHVLCKAPAVKRVAMWTCRHACGAVADLPGRLLGKAIPCGACRPADWHVDVALGLHVACGSTHLVGTDCPEPVAVRPAPAEVVELRPGYATTGDPDLCTRCQAPENIDGVPECVCDRLWPTRDAMEAGPAVEPITMAFDVELPPFDSPAPTTRPAEPPGTTGSPERNGPYRDVLLDVIGQAIERRDERGRQSRVGPSELGGCERKLAHRLAEGRQENRGDRWRPQVGTAVHAWLETAFATSPTNGTTPQEAGLPGTMLDGGPRWLTEQRVTVGRVGEQEITGSVDLFDRLDGRVIDHKVVGPTTLKRAKAGHASGKYHGQIQLYALGLERELGPGSVVTVSLLFLPAAGTLDEAVLLSWPYDREVGSALLERADRLATLLTMLPAERVIALATVEEDYCPSCPVLASGQCPGMNPGAWQAAPAPVIRFKGRDHA